MHQPGKSATRWQPWLTLDYESRETDDDKLGIILEELKTAEIDLPATTGMSSERIADVLVDPVDFEPDEADVLRLDQQGMKKTTCPSCGYAF